MNKKLFEFQEEAIEELQKSFKELWKVTDDIPQILLKAPTGAGKTVITSAFIDSLQTESSFLPRINDVAFIWVTFSKLADQSRNSYYNTFFPNLRNTLSVAENCSNVLRSNEILFINWEKLSQSTNKDRLKLRRPINPLDRKEEGVYFEDIIENTKAEGRDIVLIIDESHSHVDTANSKSIMNIISPRLIYKMSATPFKTDQDENTFFALVGKKKGAFIEVDRQKVIDAGLIKQEIKCQTEDDLKRFKDANIDEVMLDLAIEKRNQIKAEWEKIGLNINPLCLIQLPNDDRTFEDQTETKEEFTLRYLKRKGISENRIGIWLSKEGNEVKPEWRLTDNDSEIDFLLFKLAAGTGWDCPRAHVLVMYREIKSPVFQSQTLGRIVRMACFDEKLLEGHSMLKTGYLYTTYERNKVALTETNGEKNKQKIHTSKLVYDVKTTSVVKTFENDLTELFSKPNSIIDKINDALDKEEITSTETSLPELQSDKIVDIVNSAKEIINKNINSLHVEESTLFTDDEMNPSEKIATEVPVSNKKIASVLSETKNQVITDMKTKMNLDSYSPLFRKEIEDIIEDAIQTSAGRKDAELITFDPLLKSDFLSRTDYGDLGKTTEFQKSFKSSMHKYFGTKETNSFGEDDKTCLERFAIDLTPELTKRMMVNEVFRAEEDYDNKKEVESTEQNVSDIDASHYFTLVCMAIIKESSVGNVSRSWSPLRNALQQWVRELNMPEYIKIEDWYRILVKDFNKDSNSSIKKGVLKAIEDYLPIRQKFLEEKQKLADENSSMPFRIKTEYNYTADYEVFTPAEKSFIQPFYLLKEYRGRENETRFIEYLEGNSEVKNWFKNGSNGKESFCIKYFNITENEYDGFYPDWIVVYNNGDIGIYDTKSGFTAWKQSQDTRDKAKALHEKIDYMNQCSKIHYVGGIIELVNGVWTVTSKIDE